MSKLETLPTKVLQNSIILNEDDVVYFQSRINNARSVKDKAYWNKKLMIAESAHAAAKKELEKRANQKTEAI